MGLPPYLENYMNCTICAATLTGRQRKFCSDRCGQVDYGRRRVADGRMRVQRAKHADYMSAYAKRRYTGTTGVPIADCAACGEPTGKAYSSARRQVCSFTCRHYLRFGVWPSTKVPGNHPARPPRVRPDRRTLRCWMCDGLYAGLSRDGRCVKCNDRVTSRRVHYCDCIVCSSLFVTPAQRRTCSDACESVVVARRRAVGKSRRRARMRNAFVADVDPMVVYERDGWRCHLCNKKINKAVKVPHPLAPTLDHVLPLAKGGTHEPLNCRAAHFLCNALKSDGGGGEQLLLLA